MWQLTKLGVKFIFCAGLYVAVAVITYLSLLHPDKDQLPNVYFRQVEFFVLIYVPGWIAWKAIRRFRRRNGVVLPRGRHILYLRSFSVDATPINEIFRLLNRTFARGPLQGDTTLEVGVASAMEPVGECVAIGRPVDFVTPDGAERIYVGDDSWQQTVTDLIRSARAIVMVSGTTEGIAWEKERIRKCVDPRRLLLILPSAGSKQRQRMAELSSRHLRTPISLPSSDLDNGGPLFYTFDSGWAASLLPRQDSRTGLRLLRFEILPRVIDFGETLMPFVKALPASSTTRVWWDSQGRDRRQTSRWQ